MSQALLPLKIDGMWLALPANRVREVVGRRPLVPIPGARPEVPGVIEWNGRALAVVDLACAVLAGPPSDAPRERVVIVDGGASLFALPVDQVRGVQEVPEDSVLASRATSARFTSQEVELSGAAVAVLDVPELVRAYSAAPVDRA